MTVNRLIHVRTDHLVSRASPKLTPIINRGWHHNRVETDAAIYYVILKSYMYDIKLKGPQSFEPTSYNRF
jgi:hypothetical protein